MSGSGFADLAYYGGFHVLARLRDGSGSPTALRVGLGWDPYMAGAWMFTSGLDIRLGLGLSVGLDAISLRLVGLFAGGRVVLVSGQLVQEWRRSH